MLNKDEWLRHSDGGWSMYMRNGDLVRSVHIQYFKDHDGWNPPSEEDWVEPGWYACGDGMWDGNWRLLENVTTEDEAKAVALMMARMA